MLRWRQPDPLPHVIGIGSHVNGKYEIVRLLGDGGMGSVYEGKHTVLGTRVAIKVLHPELARRTGLVERFLQEARVAAQIRSPHVVQVTDVDRTAEGDAYIVMELLEGEPLSAVMDRQRKLPVPQACDYTLQVLEALEAAHALGVIHRDLKPENVFLTFSGSKPLLKLIDFGIAKARRTDPQQKHLTVAGVVMGTAEYMAPEQARSADKVDARADLYAVGVMLYEMISGARPVQGDDARVIALKVERGEIIPLVQVAPDVPREIAGLVHRSMAARPELRFATATEMRLALEKAAAGKRGATAPLPVSAPGLPELSTNPGATVRNVSNAPVTNAPAGAGVAGGEREAAPNTERAPPIVTAQPMGPASPPTPAYAGVALSPAPQARTPRRRGGIGRTLALVALPILVGIAIVLILVATNTWSPTSFSSSSSTATATATPPPPPPSPPDTTTAPAPPPTVATITPSPSTPPAPTAVRPGPGPRPGPGRPSLDAGGAPPPFILPSTIPTAFPSAFGLPSSFPTAFPVWPPPGNPPGPAHSGGGGGI